MPKARHKQAQPRAISMRTPVPLTPSKPVIDNPRYSISSSKHGDESSEILSQELPRLQVTIAEAAEMMGYSEDTIRRLLERGLLPSIGTRRLRRIAIEDLREYQRRNRVVGSE